MQSEGINFTSLLLLMPLHSLRLEMQSLLMNQGACFEFPHAKRRKINLKFNALSPASFQMEKNAPEGHDGTTLRILQERH